MYFDYFRGTVATKISRNLPIVKSSAVYLYAFGVSYLGLCEFLRKKLIDSWIFVGGIPVKDKHRMTPSSF